MKLVNKNQSVPGGFYYIVPETGDKVGTDGNFDRLLDTVAGYYRLKNITPPEFWEAAVEDQICSRVPDRYCRYTKGLGDLISRGVHAVTGAIDKVFGTELKKKARGCGGCARRRQKLNRGN